MILLERGNRILGETVSSKFFLDADEKVEPMDVKLCDFDDVSYRVLIEPESKNIMTVSMNCPCFKSIEDRGAREAFEKRYGDLVSTEALAGYDVTLKINLDELKDQKHKETLVSQISQLKATVIGGVFNQFFTNLAEGKETKNFSFQLRADTTIYFVPKNDRVTVLFTVDFKEKVDRAVARVFMQEFAEARAKDRTLGATPPVAFTVQPPLELKDFGIVQAVPGILGFVSFSVMRAHVDKQEKRDKVVAILQGFRNFMQYHIKCSKAYFHSRMRLRAQSLLGVLNRAKPEVDPKTVQARTMSGRTFTRKA
jgi:actin related protein 2/3 complex subunit 2